MVSEKKYYYEVGVSSHDGGGATHVCTKILSKQQGIQKMGTRIFNSFSPWLLPSYVPVILIEVWAIYTRKEYTYRRKEFQNILERKLCNCFGRLLLACEKNVEHGMEHDIDSVLMEFASIRNSRILRQVWWILCNWSRWWIWQSVIIIFYKIFL